MIKRVKRGSMVRSKVAGRDFLICAAANGVAEEGGGFRVGKAFQSRGPSRGGKRSIEKTRCEPH